MAGRYKAYAEYKESGIEWLEKIPTHWSSKALKFLCTYNDEVINETTEPETIIEYVDIGSVSAVEGISKTEKVAFGKSPSRARRIVRNGDVIVSTVRTYLEAIAPITNPPENMIVSTGFAVIRPNSKLDKGFAAYCLRAKGFIREVVARSVGISYPAINATELVGISVPYLPYEEQQKIANFLDHETAKIDTLIAKQEKLIELLKEKRQAVISHAVTKGLNPQVPMRDSGVEWLGEVPEHWVVSKLGLYAHKIGSGKTPKGGADVYQESGVLFLRSQNIYDEGLRISDTEATYISDSIHSEMLNTSVKPFDVLLNITGGSIGRTCIVPATFVEANVNQHVCILRFSKSIALYFANVMKSSSIKEQIDVVQVGGNREGLNFEQIANMKVCIPPKEEMSEINEFIQSQLTKFDELVQKANNAIVLMKERKTALISAAVTGKIDVRDFVLEQGQPQGV